MKKNFKRRDILKTAGVTGAVAMTAGLTNCVSKAEETLDEALKSRIKHSVCAWCYGDIPFEELCAFSQEIGLQSIEIIESDKWEVLKKYDLTCAMGSVKTAGIQVGWNDLSQHDRLIKLYEETIPVAAELGVPTIIAFSGNRNGMDDQQGLENCVTGLQKIMPLAEKYKVNVMMELLNSKVDHKDYMCDRTPWGVELVNNVKSDRFKLLYDIYHMQIMEGDVMATIRDNHEHIGHYHTGGVPGRNEIDDSQELFYPAIVKAILDTGYKGFLGQEFIPKRKDKLASLEQGVRICDV